MLVKCWDINEKRERSESYKAPNNKYYTSKEAYEKILQLQIDREKCIDKMYDLMGYQRGMLIPTIFNKKLKEYEVIGYDTLYDTMCYNENSIGWAIQNKTFNSESSKVLYIMAILRNNVMDIYNRKKLVQKQEKKHNNLVENIDLSAIGNNKSGTNVASFLGEDEWI